MKKTNLLLRGINALVRRTKRNPKDENAEIDGGVTRHVDTEAPKQINSNLIIRFSVEISTLADVDDNEYCGYVYNLNAVLENGAVKASYKCRDRCAYVFEQNFRESVRFMRGLYSIVSEYDFAKYNGVSCFVSGLPDNYGSCVDIMFASGERIYASDNQSNFIPGDAVVKLVDLFESRAISISDCKTHN